MSLFEDAIDSAGSFVDDARQRVLGDRAKTKSQTFMDRLETPKKKHTGLRFPEDLDTDGHGNIIRFKIALPTGSKYLGSKYKAVDPSTGQSTTTSYRENGRGSIARRFSENYTMTTTTIDLFMPGQVQTTYSSDWNSTEIGSVGAAIDAVSGAMNTSTRQQAMNEWSTIKEVLSSSLMNTLAGTAQGMTPINAKDALSVSKSKRTNPYMEVLFNGVTNRTFSFTFKMIPRSQAEQEAVRDIVKEFRFHRAPEFVNDKNNMYMRFPSEFDVEFLHRSEENPWLFKISTCALTNVSVSHSPEGQYSSHSDGAPFATEMTLEFTEILTLSKEDHERGL